MSDPTPGLRITQRHPYSDVDLLTATDAHADRWILERFDKPKGEWRTVPAEILDSRINWSTPDLSRWEQLRRLEADASVPTEPDAVVQPTPPFAVSWDVSSYAGGFRFTDPSGGRHEFEIGYQREFEV